MHRIKESEDSERGGGGGLFEGGDYLKYFCQRGRLIEGRLLFEEIQFPMIAELPRAAEHHG